MHVPRALIAFLTGTLMCETGGVTHLCRRHPGHGRHPRSGAGASSWPHIAACGSELAVINHEREMDYGVKVPRRRDVAGRH